MLHMSSWLAGAVWAGWMSAEYRLEYVDAEDTEDAEAEDELNEDEDEEDTDTGP